MYFNPKGAPSGQKEKEKNASFVTILINVKNNKDYRAHIRMVEVCKHKLIICYYIELIEIKYLLHI